MNARDLWIELSIREIHMQCRFAEISYSHIEPKAVVNNDAIFSSIHSFLSHSALVSKMLSGKFNKEDSQTIGDLLNVELSSSIHDRKLRNHLEHYEERLKEWIGKYGVNINIGDCNIGPKLAYIIPNFVFVRHYDPQTKIFTFVNDDFDLVVLKQEVNRIKSLANRYMERLKI